MKNNLNNELIIATSARLVNDVGFDNLSLKMLAEELNIKPPSLYNYIASLDDIKSKLMLYGWQQLQDIMLDAAVGVSGYEALRNMCYAFYEYATNNKGIFNAMLWYNKYDSIEATIVTKRLFNLLFKILSSFDINEDNINHVIRTLRSFLEGFALLVNNNAFGNPLSVKQSFDISLNIILNGIKSLEGVK